MEHDNVPQRLTDKEFEIMMREFDLAQDWMRERIELGRRRLIALSPGAVVEDADVCRGDSSG
ncbi:Unknown protein sequence [Pseudomonas amygdali pv. eriobotryae]|uniref:Uncharacterized protein n=1 Tax=Pseudomonas amygdali pv. eriobotryae TaxID=129137 RepID=A0A0P9PUZ5_PSEA0|nr:Unknown protein sequence [Pseudomonas amygdali pv. eriobotryae]KWS75522.1 hypothetical protein AL052_08770 [Pseudomonas amygdali pv. eriobotryae]RMO64403.1 hypothetical protein ALQ39_04083 [Pseudomonas amygdali pv. eriobotryae]GFZ73617.1 hypothetical protein PSE10C_43590 [Pseudomonas amygdali pv. eriobotryae]